MHIGQQGVRRSRQNRAGFNNFAQRILPAIPDSGEGEDRIVGHAKMEWLLCLAFLLLFVKAVSRDQAAAILERLPKSWFFGNGLGSGINHFVPDVGILRPERNQPPPDNREVANRAFLVLPHHGDPLRRGDVIPGRPLDLLGNLEVLGDLFVGSGKPESSAHGGKNCSATRTGRKFGNCEGDNASIGTSTAQYPWNDGRTKVTWSGARTVLTFSCMDRRIKANDCRSDGTR